MTRALLLVALLVALLGGVARAGEPPLRLHVELDPLPLARAGYGGQVGVHVTPHLRVAAASFALDVPDFAIQAGGNDGWHARVRPSAALYVLYYPSTGRDGWAFGGAVRYLHIIYSHDNRTDEANVLQLSPELIVAYRWHPWRAGFYVQPWFGLSAVLHQDAEPTVGGLTYDASPVQPFFTVNLGWEFHVLGED